MDTLSMYDRASSAHDGYENVILEDDMPMPDKITVASYNMSFMSDKGFKSSDRNWSSEGAFLSRLDPAGSRDYWLNALELLNDFMKKHNDCIIGLQELNQTEPNSKQGSDAINTMLQQHDGYIQVGNFVEAKDDTPGLSIIYNEKIFGKVIKKQIYDLVKGKGRPRLFVLTEKGYLFINIHGNQDAKKTTEKDVFNRVIIRDNVNNLKRDLNDFLINEDITKIEGIFLMGDFNDRYDAIKDIEILPNRTLKYKGDAPKSCCYNWDSSCSLKRYNEFDLKYGYCNKPDKDVMFDESQIDKENNPIKKSMNDNEGAKLNYKYRGDKVFGENPFTEIKIFDNTNTKISEESDHQMVYAVYNTKKLNVTVKDLISKFNNPTGGRSKKHPHKTRKGMQQKKTRRIQRKNKINRKTNKGNKQRKNRKTKRRM